MQNGLRSIGWKAGQIWQNKTQNGIPKKYLGIYTILLNKLITHHKELIEDIINHGGGIVKLPVSLNLLEKYLDGYLIEYIGFESPLSGFEGHWEIDQINKSKFNIFYNTNCSPERQKITKVHEFFHIFQYLDPSLRNFIDNLKYKTTLPGDIILKLINRSADKGATMFLMPNKYVVKKYSEIKDVNQLAYTFGVSKEAMYWRLKECSQI